MVFFYATLFIIQKKIFSCIKEQQPYQVFRSRLIIVLSLCPDVQKTSRELQDCIAEIEQLASSAIKSVKTVRSFRAEAQELKRYQEALDRKLQILKRKGIFSAVHLLLRRVSKCTHSHIHNFSPTCSDRYMM